MTYCAPGVKHKDYTCFNRSALGDIAESFNKKYNKKKINITTGMNDHEVWNKIRDGMADVCGDKEWCWLDQSFLKNNEEINSFYRPPKPDEPMKWLSTGDINRVLKQYENIYEDFAFMGTVPIDFDKIIEEYARMDMCSLYNGKGMTLQNGKSIYAGRKVRRFGFVFNLDPHNKKGSHWVSMFMDLTVAQPFIGYFDSYGYCPPPPQMMNLMDRLKAQVNDCLKITLVKKCNMIRHQHGHTECGTYSLYFIYSSLEGKSFEDVTEDIILDDDVNKFRDLFFRPTVAYFNKNGRETQ